jgi:DNA-binding NtrC family response regulator
LVLLDMTMPYLDGAQAFQAMQRIGSGVPSILSSGYTEEMTIERCADRGLAAFIQKPYEYHSLLTVVRQALGEQGESRSPLIRSLVGPNRACEDHSATIVSLLCEPNSSQH